MMERVDSVSQPTVAIYIYMCIYVNKYITGLAVSAVDSSGSSLEISKQLIVDVQQKMDSFCASVQVRLDHLSNVCKSSLHSVQTEVRVSQPSASVNVIDRKQNIIVCGVS